MTVSCFGESPSATTPAGHRIPVDQGHLQRQWKYPVSRITLDFVRMSERFVYPTNLPEIDLILSQNASGPKLVHLHIYGERCPYWAIGEPNRPMAIDDWSDTADGFLAMRSSVQPMVF